MGQETKCGPVVSVLVADNVEVPRPSPALTTSSPTSCIGRICFIVDLINLFTSSICQLFWTQANPEGMCTNGTQVPCEVPSLPNPTTRKGWPHHRGLRPLLFSDSDVGSFTSHKNKSVKVLWDGTYGFSSLSEKTRTSNHLQMSLQRQHLLLSYLKTLSVGPAGVWTRDLPLDRPALSQLSESGGGRLSVPQQRLYIAHWFGSWRPSSIIWDFRGPLWKLLEHK